MTATTIRTDVLVAPQPVRRLDWAATVALHLGPGAVTFGAAFAFGPVLRALDLPAHLALTLAFALVLTPIELGLLLHAAHKVTGRWSLRALPSVLSLRRRLPPRTYAMLIPSLLAILVGVLVVLEPVTQAVEDVYPIGWLLPADSEAFPTGLLVAVLLLALVVDGLIRPTVEELYFRAYLLPRLPVKGAAAVVVSAALFAGQHYWQPEMFAFIFVAQLVLTAVVVRLGSVRIGIIVRCLVNSTGTLLALAAILT